MSGAKALEWPAPPALEGVKSRKRPVLWVGGRLAPGAPLELSLQSRVAIAGLSPGEIAALQSELSCVHSPDRLAAGEWQVRSHEALRVMVMPAISADSSLEEWLTQAAGSAPHALALPSAALSRGSRALGALSSFPGALLLLEDPGVEAADAARHAQLIHALGVTARWQARAPGAGGKLDGVVTEALAPVPLPALPRDVEVGTKYFLHDVRIRSPIESETYPEAPGLAELLNDQLAPLYMEEFGADLGNLGQAQNGYDMRLSLFVEQQPLGEAPELLGFLAYKVWGAPQPCVSVCAVGVPKRFRGCGYGRRLMNVAEEEATLSSAAAGLKEPGKVSLRSFPSSVRFYTRLGYTPTEGLGEGFDEDDDDGPCVPMARQCGPVPSKLAAGGSPRPLEPWSPRRARHLEDGPTWLPAEDFAPTPAAAAHRARHLEDGPTWLPAEDFAPTPTVAAAAAVCSILLDVLEFS